MRPADSPDHLPAPTTWSETALVELTIRLANDPAYQPARHPAPANAGPLSGRVADRGNGVLPLSTAPADRGKGVLPLSTASAGRGAGALRFSTAPPDPGTATLRPSPPPPDAAWSIPLLITPDVEAWLLGWPAGLVTGAHDHGGATVAVTVVEGSLSEECLDPTIWTTGRRTTWRAGASTVFPSGHVHLLGAAGGRPAVAVHAWSGPAGSADRVAGRLALVRT
jgi:quercetin dioxygenase-like cupin family protein